MLKFIVVVLLMVVNAAPIVAQTLTLSPTRSPTKSPSRNPTKSPTRSPTKSPTSPTRSPTQSPTRSPTKSPTSFATTVIATTQSPTISPPTSGISYIYNFTVEYIYNGTVETCFDVDLQLVSNSVSGALEVYQQNYFSTQNLPGTVGNTSIGKVGRSNRGRRRRRVLLGEVMDDMVANVVSVVSMEEEEISEKQRQRRLLFSWKVGGSATCRGCFPANSDFRLRQRRLVGSISKLGLSNYVNQFFPGFVRRQIGFLGSTANCAGSRKDWTALFQWV